VPVRPRFYAWPHARVGGCRARGPGANLRNFLGHRLSTARGFAPKNQRMSNSFGARSTLKVGTREYEIYRLSALTKAGIDPARLPYSLRILLENLLRLEDGKVVKEGDIRALGAWDPKATPSTEIAFMPARVLLQDFTGVPTVVDLAAMRDAMKRM